MYKKRKSMWGVNNSNNNNNNNINNNNNNREKMDFISIIKKLQQ